MKVFKAIVLVLSLGLTLFANEIFEIQDDFKSADASAYVYYLNDKNNLHSPEDILKEENLTKAPIGGQLKLEFGPIYSKLALKNSSSTLQTLLLHNPLPGTNTIDVYVYKNNALFKTYLLGDMRKQESKAYVNRYALFELSLMPNEEVSVVSKVSNFNIHNISWQINTPQMFMEKESRTLIYLSLAGGIFFTFIILNLILFTIHKSIIYGYLAALVTMSFLYLFAVNGFLYQLDMGLSLDLLTAIAWITPSISSLFFLGFVYHYFNMSQRYKKSALSLKLLIFINTAIIVSYPLSFYVSHYFFILVNLSGVAFGATVIFMFIIGLYMKSEGLKFYLAGQIIYLLVAIVYTAAVFGFIPYVESYRYGITLGGLIEIALLMAAQTIKSKKQFDKLQRDKIILMEESRFLSIDHVVSNIVHQWKHPLAQVGTSMTLIETFIHHNEKDAIKQIKSELPKINFSLELMIKTLEEFSSGSSRKIQKAPFSPLETLQKILQILHTKIILLNVTVRLTIDEELQIVNYEHIFSNIMMNFIDNSLDQFHNQKTNLIEIDINEDSQNYIIRYTDNAGGITQEPIEQVFEYGITTKEESKTHGRGLAMVKMLVEDQLNGTIDVKNTHDGVEFLITLKKEV
jgi:two-component system, sensor histidine kinase LadS